MVHFIPFILLLVTTSAMKQSPADFDQEFQADLNPLMNVPAGATRADTDIRAASAHPEGRPKFAETPREESSFLVSKGLSTLSDTGVKFSAVLAEYIAMTLFVVIGCGSAMGIAKEPGSAWIFQVSLTFGLAITVLAYAIGHYSGGQINCAVTLGLVLTGNCTIVQGLLNFIAQMLGSVTGAFILLGIFPREKDLTGGLATNSVSEGWSAHQALIGEFMMTFLLVFVVLETAINEASSANRAQAPIAIGFAVFLAHSVLIPIDGCSINPTRSFGPAIVGYFTKSSSFNPLALSDMWIFWVGPLLGAVAAAGVSYAMVTGFN